VKDFYLPDRALHAYLEKDWFDHIERATGKTEFTFAPFPAQQLYCDYHEKFVGFLKDELTRANLQPESVLEIGSALGRTFYELAINMKSVRKATLVEPSKNMLSLFNRIFSWPDDSPLTILKGNVDTAQVKLNTDPIRKAVEGIEVTTLNSPFADLKLGGQKFDLVICSNVIDQCVDPLKLADMLKAHCAPGGVVLLSCTYQWQQKYIGNAGHQIRDINELFGSGWKPLGQTNIPFQVRVYERHWLSFLSHAVAYQLQH